MSTVIFGAPSRIWTHDPLIMETHLVNLSLYHVCFQIRCSTSWAIRAIIGASDRIRTCIFHPLHYTVSKTAVIQRHYLWCSFWIRTSPTQFNETRLTVRHYGLKSIISVFSCTIEGIEPSFQTNVRYQAAHGIEPCFPPGFRRNRTGITSIVHVKIEILFSATLSKRFAPLSPLTPQKCPPFRRCIVYVKTEYPVFMRTPSTKERTDTFVGLFFCFSDLSSSFL